MVQTVIMPKLGQTVEESTVIRWHKKEGDSVRKGDILFEIETDKAVLEVESFFEGTLLKIVVQKGETVPVTSTVAFIGQPGDAVPDVVPVAKPATPEPEKPAPSIPSLSSSQAIPEPVAPSPAPDVSLAPSRQKKSVSPRARRLIKDCAISAEPISGSGSGGRVVEKDVLAYLDAAQYHLIRITPAAKALARKENIDILSAEYPGDRITVDTIRRAIAEKPKAMSRIRQVIAERLTRSFTTTPHFFVTGSVDMTDLLDLRKNLKKEGKPYSVTDFVLKAVATALTDFPALNSSTDGKTVRWHSRIHIGMAVAIKEGLIVPVIRNADEISLMELHDCVKELAAKARGMKLTPDEMTGSTFTVSNMGMLNVENFTAIINPGESAILAVSSMRKEPVVIKDDIVIRSIMKITLSSDHRVVDGAVAAGFINKIKKLLEDVEVWKNLT